MESQKRNILLVLVLLISLPAKSANQPADPISNTRTASCLVKITSDPLVLPLDVTTIKYLLYSTNIGGKVTREVLDISSDQISTLFTIEALASSASRILQEPVLNQNQSNQNEYDTTEIDSTVGNGSTRTNSTSNRMPSLQSPRSIAEQTILFKLQINLPQNTKPAAKEFMDALVINLRSTLVKAHGDYTLRLRSRLKLADEEATRAELDLRKQQRTLREISGTNVLDRNKILAEISRLRQEVQTAKMNQASNQVIIDATTKRIAEIQAKIEEKLENDPITKEYQGIVERSDKLVEQAEQAVLEGTMPATQLDVLKGQLSQARISYVRRREELSRAAGGNLIDSLNKDLSESLIKATQDEAYLTNQEQQLREAEKLLEKSDDYELLSLKTEIAKQCLQEAMLWRDRTSRQMRLIQPPMVSIVGGQ